MTAIIKASDWLNGQLSNALKCNSIPTRLSAWNTMYALVDSRERYSTIYGRYKDQGLLELTSYLRGILSGVLQPPHQFID